MSVVLYVEKNIIIIFFNEGGHWTCRHGDQIY